ncbi:BACON domain-containing protein [uncultured Alistipes sp.]|uniref:BACON domain-containing protein n=1 Tax=uncultured Alistipes sp. TaxID=538949 RepID=UPI0025CE05FC|nr:BACON domain-containing protein [uncultured Alistipes sp.]
MLSAVVFAACEEDPDPDAFLSITQQEIVVEYNGVNSNGDQVSFELGSNRSWEATYVESWIELTHTEGERGRTLIFLSFEENDTKKDRDGYIVFEGEGGLRRTIAVTQKLKVDRLTVSPPNVTAVKSGLLENGEKASIYISTNCDWTIDMGPNSSWITPAKMFDKAGDMVVELDITKNTTDGERTGSFVVTGGDVEVTVTVTQNLDGLKVDTSSFAVNKFGFIDEEQTPLTFTVIALEAWTAVSDGWITISPDSGEAGEVEVTMIIGENSTGATRTGEVKLTTTVNGLDASVKVRQNTKNTPLDDDGKAVGYVYYDEPFDWAIPFGKDDQVGTGGVKGSTLSIYENSDNGREAKAAFEAAGLTDYNAVGSCMYVASDYLKMGKGSNQTGIILPAMTEIATDTYTDVELSFEACVNVGGGGPDATTVTVEIVSGPGSVDVDKAKLSEPMTPYPRYEWTPMSVKLYGITADTKLAIRSTQQGVTGYYRWFLDDIKMTKIAE